ncbi:phospholipase [Sphingomonas lutea]|uniref:Phospholipase D n=1 Tax=Sphingomonas lutea TaxID=1045317 RepID=A0A7G9SH37_9SPHN|nr:phospholipase D-like domain-containing protein [Sphingomonas lutea]QNN67162.1 phospholipase [Sphingomonas lutea]
MLRAGRNCWRIERANRAAVVIDAEDYFRLARQAMLRAKSQILLIGWDFDTRICLDYDADDGAPNELGKFLTWLPKQRPGLQIHILKWDIGAIKLAGRGTTILRLLRWAASDQIHFKLDGAHAVGASHHHKIAVIDDALAFCGGIDMAGSRWDTREHLDCDEHRRRPTTRRRYQPWHDATMAVDGPAAAGLGELARNRWKAAGGTPISAPRARSDPWPEALAPQFENIDVAIARTRAAYDDEDCIREIEALYIDMVRRARRFIYAENQYFASRAIAEAIEKRLGEPDGPEFVIVNPKSGQGWLDETAMSPARAELFRRLQKADVHDRFRIFTPVTAQGEDIYVHSKITIVDDEMLRVGSANLNNRSMGLDSECDLMLDATRKRNAAAAPAIAELRADLLAEHLGVSVDRIEAKMAKTGSLVRTIDSFARGKGRSLIPFVPEKPLAIERNIARNEALDPESAGTDFEPMARPGLLARLGR